MTDFVVHNIPGSPFGRAVLIALEEKGASYRVARVGLATMRAPEHLARHPFGRVPAIEHGDFRLYETQAILRYVDRVLGGAPLTPADPRTAARMDQLMNINDWYLFRDVGIPIGFQRVIVPRLMGGKADEAVVAAAMPKADAVFAQLSALLADQAYFTGSEVTLADVMLAPQLDLLREAAEWAALTRTRPNLEAWLTRMAARPSLAATTWDRVESIAEAA